MILSTLGSLWGREHTRELAKSSHWRVSAKELKGINREVDNDYITGKTVLN